MSRYIAKMNLIAAVQRLPEKDIGCVQDYVEVIEDENIKLKEQLKQRDEVIDEAIKFIFKKRYQPSPLGFELELNPSELYQLQNILQKYKGDNDERKN